MVGAAATSTLEAALEQLAPRQLLAAGLALGGLLLLALFWGLYLGTPPAHACADGSGTCPAQLPAFVPSPLVLAVFGTGYLSLLGALLIAFPSRLLYATAAIGALGWALPTLIAVGSQTYGEISVTFFVIFLLGAGAHVSMPAIALRTAIRQLSLGFYPVVAVGVAGVVMVVLAQLVGDVAPAPLVGSAFAFWGFGGAVAALANQPWKLVR